MSDALEIVSAAEEFTVVQAVDSGILLRHNDGEPCCQIASSDDGTVASILLQFAPITSLGETLAVYGEPDYVSGQTFTEMEAVILLYYTQHNMLLYVVVPGVEGQLEEFSPVVSAVYATEELLAQAFGATPFDVWKGYLKYSEYMDGEFDFQP